MKHDHLHQSVVMSRLKRGALWCAPGLLAIAMGSKIAIAQDAAAYQKACGDCHSSPAVIARKIKGSTQEEKRAFLTALLEQHHTPSKQAVDQIIKYLLELPPR